MSSFSTTEAAFTGLRIVRAQPAAAAVWGLVQLVTSVAAGVFLIVSAGPALTQLRSAGTLARDPTALFAVYRQLAAPYGILVLFSLVYYPVIYAAMNRAVLRPADSALGYLRLGADEWRQFLLLLSYGLLFLGAYIALIVVAVIVGGIVGVLAGGAGSIVGVLAIFVAFAAVACALVYLAVRLSLASALTFASRKVNVFGSWTMTRGRFWPIFGAYFLAFVLILLVTLITGALSGVAALTLGGASNLVTMFTRPDMTSLSTYFSPARIVALLLGAASGAVTLPLAITPGMEIYRSLAESYGHPGGEGPAIDEVFS